ncbi:MAG TPA: NDP-sugar synthase [Candidatus Peribacteraceae bacterium]|nr:NDP-sugar synthase [Candidatus Peribacteraceae bacterium]
MKAFILAGGFATRLWPLTERRAKPLLPLAGRPLLSHLVERIPREIPVTISTNAVFEAGFQQWKEFGGFTADIMIEDTRHDDRKLGALGAVARWLQTKKIDDDLLLLAGDNYCGFSFADFLATYKEDALLAAYDVGDRELAKHFGTVILEPQTTKVIAFEEKPAAPKTSFVSTGCSVLPKRVLPILIEFAQKRPDNIGGIFEELLRRGERVEAFRFTEPWFDIGSFHSYLEATRKVVGNGQILGHGTNIQNTECTGSVVAGTNCSIKDSVFQDVVLFDNCIVEDCHLRDCVVDSGCRLNGVDLDGQMLRQHTVLNTKH